MIPLFLLILGVGVIAAASASSKEGGEETPPGAVAQLSSADQIALLKFLAPTHLVLDVPQPTGFELATAVVNTGAVNETSDVAVYRENMDGAFVFTNRRASATDPVKIIGIMPGTPGQLPPETLAAMGYVLFLKPKEIASVWAFAYPGAAAPALDAGEGPQRYNPSFRFEDPSTADRMADPSLRNAALSIEQLPDPPRTLMVFVLSTGNAAACMQAAEQLSAAGFTRAAEQMKLAAAEKEKMVRETTVTDRSAAVADQAARAVASRPVTTRAATAGVPANPRSLDVHELPETVPGPTEPVQLHAGAVAAFEGSDGGEALRWSAVLQRLGFILASSQLLARARQLGDFNPLPAIAA